MAKPAFAAPDIPPGEDDLEGAELAADEVPAGCALIEDTDVGVWRLVGDDDFAGLTGTSVSLSVLLRVLCAELCAFP